MAGFKVGLGIGCAVGGIVGEGVVTGCLVGENVMISTGGNVGAGTGAEVLAVIGAGVVVVTGAGVLAVIGASVLAVIGAGVLFGVTGLRVGDLVVGAGIGAGVVSGPVGTAATGRDVVDVDAGASVVGDGPDVVVGVVGCCCWAVGRRKLVGDIVAVDGSPFGIPGIGADVGAVFCCCCCCC